MKIENGKIVIENPFVKLVINERCAAESLVLKSNGEELLAEGDHPIFSVTQERPYNNEIKLIYMNKRTTYPANRVRIEDGKLIVGFELAPYEAAVSVKITDSYIAFTLSDFIVKPDNYDYLKMSTPPAAEFRLLSLPVKNRERFGKWINAEWDSTAAVAVVATDATARIEAEARRGFRILTADAIRGIKLRGCTAALVATDADKFLDAIGALESDFGMPLGVASRKNELIKASICWLSDLTPENVDYYVDKMKKGGFRLCLIYYPSFFEKGARGYLLNNEFKFRKEYPRGLDDVRGVVNKIKDAGITVGFHFLHTHIGMQTHYVTPHADHRLNTTRNFTLSRSLDLSATEIFVNENPVDTVMHEDCRILKFGTELISYEGYETEPPYRFFGCRRGAWDTEIVEHPAGEIGGILDISEFSASSVYLNQNSDIQEEIAAKIAEVYSTGFEFAYFDGSEGTNAPFEYHIPNAQHRVYKHLCPAPIFCEGAAKSHFGWHMLSGANAFDIFPTDIFKRMIDKYPVVAAEEMQNDFTRVNFGWWAFYEDTRPDVYEYGIAKATAWDCPATVMFHGKHENTLLLDDTLEVIRRWEDAKSRGFFTDEIKAMLRRGTDEYILITDANGEYALCRTEEVGSGAEGVYFFAFEHNGIAYASVCKPLGAKDVLIPSSEIEYLTEPYGKPLPIEKRDAGAVISVSSRAYLKHSSIAALKDAIANAKLI